ncbi:tetratricopeptide repeat protein [Candidatus Eisenbacteria bacterium]|uniref:Tetratricopeptide repeat protein n=1 Tax=Eiseniibacteriota bacterium TaxID=2212470 RepID=A0ABV6YPE0_UNCEI
MNQENPLNPENPEDRDRSSDDDSPHDGSLDQDSALYEIEEALKQDPQNLELLLEVSRLYHRLAMQGNEASLDMADESVKALLRLDGKNVEALSISGSLYTIKARRTTSLFKRIWYSFKAARVLDKAVELDPKNVSARTIRAFTALVLPRYQKRLGTAVGDFEYLLQVKSDDPDVLPDEMMPKVYFNLGFANVKLGNFERAREILSVVIARFPESRESTRAQSLLHKIGEGS